MISHLGRGTPIAKVNLKHAFLQCPVHPMTDACVLSMDRHFDVDLRLPFGLQSSPTRQTSWQKGCSLSRTKGNCYEVTAPGFTPEHSKPNLRRRTCIFHPATARILSFLSALWPQRTNTFAFLVSVSCVTFCLRAIVTIATGSRTPFARHKHIWGRFLGKADNRHQCIWGVRRA